MTSLLTYLLSTTLTSNEFTLITCRLKNMMNAEVLGFGVNLALVKQRMLELILLVHSTSKLRISGGMVTPDNL